MHYIYNVIIYPWRNVTQLKYVLCGKSQQAQWWHTDNPNYHPVLSFYQICSLTICHGWIYYKSHSANDGIANILVIHLPQETNILYHIIIAFQNILYMMTSYILSIHIIIMPGKTLLEGQLCQFLTFLIGVLTSFVSFLFLWVGLEDSNQSNHSHSVRCRCVGSVWSFENRSGEEVNSQ